MSAPEDNPLPLPGNDPATEPAASPAILTAPTVPPWSQFPEDLRAPWGWGELFRFLVFSLVSTVALSYLLLLVFFLAGMPPKAVQNSNDVKSLFVVVNQGFISIAVFAYLFARNRARFGGPFWRTLGWRPLDAVGVPRQLIYGGCILGGGFFALFIQLASAGIEKKTKMPIEAFFQDRRSALLLMAMSVLLAPLVEETVFRGYVYPVLARSFGISWGVLVTGTVFGLLHAPQLWGGWGHIALLVLVGIVFTYVRALSRTVVTSYLLHLSYNCSLLLAFLVTTSGLRHLPLGH